MPAIVRPAIARIAAAVCSIVAFAALAAAAPVLDERKIASDRFGNDAPWYENNIPFFESADPLLDRIYYYRWQIVRAHQRDLGPRGYISTEFLDDVGWQLDPWASLNDATGFHLLEGRWLKDRRYAGDYIDFMFEGGNDRHFAEAIADAAYRRFLVDGDLKAVARHLPAMKKTFAAWDDRYDPAKRLYWIMPLLDATEYTISSIDASGGKDGFWGGEAFRPSINSYMFANARAIARLAALSNDRVTAEAFAAKANDIRDETVESLWSDALAHFIDRYKVDNQYVKYWQPIRGRELVGYLPWTHELAPDEEKFAVAWKHVLSPDELLGEHGPRTTEPTYQYYMRQYRYDGKTNRRECQWNGPSWPFQTTQVLTGMANLLNDYRQSAVTRSDYMRLLKQYAALHLQDGRADLEEDYDPATGKPIVGLDRSHHYFHSGFDDLIISGLVGIRPREDDILEINPLVPDNPADPGYLRFFALVDVPYHGHLIGVVWDVDGTRYHLGAGLHVLVDGKVAASAPKLTRIAGLPLIHRDAAPPARPIDLAMNLVPTAYPRGNASTNATVDSLHPALDGRIWFFPEAANGWSTEGAQGPQWFSVDFGHEQTVAAAELAFYADGKSFAAPAAVKLQVLKDKRWVDVAAPRTIANGIAKAAWTPVTARQIRVRFQVPKGKSVRLVELKVF
jgi:hypothetical protein